MASYTMELRDLVEKDDMSLLEHMQAIREYIFPVNYPFYDEEFKEGFELDFVRHFYTREIGFETTAQFKLKLELWLNLNMPYYNQLFKSEGLIENPLINVDWTEERVTERDITTETNDILSGNSKQAVKGSESNKTSGNGFNRVISSDTPDSRLQLTTGEDGTGVIEYASKIDENKNKSDVDFSSSQNNESTQETNGLNEQKGKSKDQYKDLFKVKGTQGMKTESEMLMLYRQTFLRIKQDIYNEMNRLFMLVY